MFPTWDSTLFRIINTNHMDQLDLIMILLSNKFIWIPLYLFIIKKLYDQYKKEVWKSILFLLSTILLADQISSSVLKPLFKRLRPCHVDAFQSWIYLPDGCGGMYGFCSSHAANSFGLAIAIYVITKNKWAGGFLFIWACCISYSRIYLGAHFPIDVFVGALIGTMSSLVLKRVLYDRLIKNS